MDFNLDLDVRAISDYQVQLLWGKEAQAFKKLHNNNPSVKLVELESQNQDLPCAIAPCQRQFVVTGNIVNIGKEVVNNLKISVAYKWIKENRDRDDLEPTTIEITDLNLSPGQDQPIELTLENTAPILDGGVYKPSLQIVR